VNTSQTSIEPQPIAVLGAGKMGEILSRGIVNADLAPASSIYLADINPRRLEDLVASYGFGSKPSNPEAVQAASIVLLAVKPQDIGSVLEEIAPAVRDGQLIISIAAGISTGFIESRLPDGSVVVRAMPNAAAGLGEGITALCGGSAARPEHLDQAHRLLAGVGKVLRIPESHIDAVTAISGSGPAYFALFAEAMIDAGVTVGLSRAVASELVVQTMVGSAAMMAQGGMSAVALREAVTSPAGTTSMALLELERAGVRAAVLNAVQAAAARARALSGEATTKG
jgi:pyrroline-5-carboxylate reductase